MNRTPKIMVVGSFVLDQIATTAIFPREGQTVLGKHFRKAPGGKGANQAVQAARLGADVTMIGKLGRDTNGEELLRTCAEAGIHTEHVLYDESEASGCAVIILEEKPDGSNQNRIIVIPGANMTIRGEELAFLKDSIAQYDLVILQLEIPMAVNCLVARYAFDCGVPVMLNCAPSAPLPDELLACLTYISPNETEAQDITGVVIAHEGHSVDMAAVKNAAGILRKKGVKNVLITLGSAGAALFSDDGNLYCPCATGITAVDPTAAGDSFIGAFCTGICCGWAKEDVLRFANHAAALTVSAMGAMPSLPKLDRVTALLDERIGGHPDITCLC